MEIIRRTFIAFLSILLLPGCVNDEDTLQGRAPLPMTFNASIDVNIIAKGLGIGLEANDTIGIFMLQGTNEIATNKKYTTTNGVLFTASEGNDIFYPDDNGSVSFITYYPYRKDQTLSIYKIDVSDQTDPHAIDLLYSNNAMMIAGELQAVDIDFRHILSKVVLFIEKGRDISDEEFTNLNIKFTEMPTKADFDLSDGTLSKGTEVADITLKKNDSIYGANVILQDAGAKILFILSNNETFTHIFTESFKSGKQHNYRVTLNRTGITVSTENTSHWKLNKIYKLLDYYPNDTKPIGVVYHIEDGGLHGKVVSLHTDYTEFQWTTIKVKLGADNRNTGLKNMYAVQKYVQDNKKHWSDFPAFEWMHKKNGVDTDYSNPSVTDVWYFPAVDELSDLMIQIARNKKCLSGIDIEIPDMYHYYWSSTEKNTENAYIIREYKENTFPKVGYRYIRHILNF